MRFSFRVCLAVLVCFYESSCQHIQECPHPEDSYPCYCEEDEDRTTMHCNYLTESKQISDALSSIGHLRFSTVSVFMYEGGEIESNAFSGPFIDEIVFSHSTVHLESPPFLGLGPALSTIKFLSCFYEDNPLRSYSLGHLDGLKELTFEKNNIPVLKNNWLSSFVPSLSFVTFDSCNIETMEDEVFLQIGKLTTLYIIDNKITNISRSMFPRPAEHLRYLSLNGNNIESLPDDIFKYMPSLKIVELERNNLKTLVESVWSGVIEYLSRVYLEDNSIVCNKDVKWILKKSLPKTFTGTCSLPSELKNKGLRNLTPADFH